MHFTGARSSTKIPLLLRHKQLFSSHIGFLTYVMLQHGDKINIYTIMKQLKGLATPI